MPLVRSLIESTLSPSPGGVTITDECLASYSGQINCRLRAKVGEATVGTLDYVVYQEQIFISMISVDEAYRRQGVGTVLMKELESKGHPISRGYRTPNGEKFFLGYDLQHHKLARPAPGSLPEAIESVLQEEILLEFDMDKTWATYKTKLELKVAADDAFDGMDPDEVKKKMLITLGTIDPTKNKEYHRWLIQVYVNYGEYYGWNSIFGYSDDNEIYRKRLERFHDLKRIKALRTEDSDILKVKHFDDLNRVIERYEDVETDKNWLKNQTKFIYQDAHCQVVQPLTHKTSKKWGSGSNWCTAADSRDGATYFDSYNRTGMLYIFIPRTEGAAKKYQAQVDKNNPQTAVMVCDDRDSTRSLAQMDKESKGIYSGALKELFDYDPAKEAEEKKELIKSWFGTVLSNRSEHLLDHLSIEDLKDYSTLFTHEFVDLWTRKLYFYVSAISPLTPGIYPNPIHLESPTGEFLTRDDLATLSSIYRNRNEWREYHTGGIHWETAYLWGEKTVLIRNPPGNAEGVSHSGKVILHNQHDAGLVLHRDLSAHPGLKDPYYVHFGEPYDKKRLDFHPYLTHLDGNGVYNFLAAYFYGAPEGEPPVEFVKWASEIRFSGSMSRWESQFDTWRRDQERKEKERAAERQAELERDRMMDDGWGNAHESVVRTAIESLVEGDSVWIYPGLCRDASAVTNTLSSEIYEIRPGIPVYKGALTREYGSLDWSQDRQGQVVKIKKIVRLDDYLNVEVTLLCTNGSAKSGTYEIHSRLVPSGGPRYYPGAGIPFPKLPSMKDIGSVEGLPLPAPYRRDSEGTLPSRYKGDFNAPLTLFIQELHRVYAYAQEKYAEGALYAAINKQQEARAGGLGDLALAVKDFGEHFEEWYSTEWRHHVGDLLNQIEPRLAHFSPQELHQAKRNMFFLTNPDWGVYAFGAVLPLDVEVSQKVKDSGKAYAETLAMTVVAEIMEEDDSEYRLSIGVTEENGHLHWVGNWLLPLSRARYDIINQVEKWKKVFIQRKYGGMTTPDDYPRGTRDRHSHQPERVVDCIESVLTEATVEKTWELWGEKVLAKEDEERPEDLAFIFRDLKNADPTTTLTYVPWLVKTYVQSNMDWYDMFRSEHYYEFYHDYSDDPDDDQGYESGEIHVRELLMGYDTLKKKNRLPATQKDINRLGLGDLIEIVPLGLLELKQEEMEKQAKKDAHRLLDTKKWLVIEPKSHAAACVYGAGTKWCTSSRDSSGHFNSYSRSGKLYIIINRNTDEKWQAHVVGNKISIFADARDNPMDQGEWKEILDQEVFDAMGVSSGPSIADITAALNKEYHNEPYYWSQHINSMAKPPFSETFVKNWLDDLAADDRQHVIARLEIE